MNGIDENVGMFGDWMQPSPSPSPRTFFASMLDDEMGSNTNSELLSNNETNGMFRGNSEQITTGGESGTTYPPPQTVDQMSESNSMFEQKPSSRGGLVERIAARTGFNAPRLNTESIRSADISLNPDLRSPYLTIPPGLSPTTLLDSPVFLSNSWAQPSPTTGKFPFVQTGNGKSSTLTSDFGDKSKDNFFDDINTSSFAFKPVPESVPSFFHGATSKSFPGIDASVHSNNSLQSQITEPVKTYCQNRNSVNHELSVEKDNGCNNTDVEDHMVFDTVGGDNELSPPLEDQHDERVSGDSLAGPNNGAPSEDGYNWRKYGQKQVKGSEYPRSYYKCTHPNCPVKKKVERSHEGHITEIIYKGAHSHPKPPPNRRSAMGSSSVLIDMQDVTEQPPTQFGAGGDSVWPKGTTDWRHDSLEVSSSASMGPEYGNNHQSAPLLAQNGTKFEQGDPVDVSSTFSNEEEEDDRGTHGSVSLPYDGEGDESESKRRKIEAYATEMSGATRAIREPRVVVQTTSEVDILDDGYRWRKYGQKVVKGNPNPRSYYKCTSAGCTVRKHVERASHDLKSVITTYEGKHNHDVPAARNNSHANSGASNGVTAQTASAVQNNVHRSEASQVYNSMGRFERPASFGSFRQQLGPSHGFSFGMNQQGLGNLGMGPMHHSYLSQQRQVNDMSFMLPKGEPKVEPISEPGMNLSNGSSVYQQIMSRMPLGPHM